MKVSKEQFLETSNKIHQNKYIYNDLSFNNVHEKITITCPIHGDFKQEVRRHMNGCKCPSCAQKKLLTNDDIIKRLKKEYDDKFTYDNLQYSGRNHKITVTCPKHGDFQMWSYPPYSSNPCPKCGSKSITTERFIEKAKKLHGNKYDYSKVEYKSSTDKISIICPKHGIFQQMPYAHLKKQGCPSCNESKLEIQIEELLVNNNIDFEKQKRFEWLGRLSLDFYLPKYNIAIECQGIQHYKPIKFYGGEMKFHNLQKRDKNKEELCKTHNVNLLYFANEHYDNDTNLITNEITLLEKIMMSLPCDLN